MSHTNTTGWIYLYERYLAFVEWGKLLEITMKQKQQWKRPQIIVLGQRKLEENVLSGCKVSGSAGPGSTPCPTNSSCKHFVNT